MAGRPDNRRLYLIITTGLAVVLIGLAAFFLFRRGPAVSSIPVTLQISTGVLHGTLVLPVRKPPYPAALIIAGSGPTDRNGNSRLIPGQNNSLKMLAQALAGRGIATLRYDKRGIGQSRMPGMSESSLRFDHFAADAAAWIRLLKRDKRFKRVVVIGHSQGSQVGILAVRRAGADALVSLAGVGRPAWQVFLDQLRPKLSLDRLAVAVIVLEDLRHGRPTTVPGRYTWLARLFRPSIQPFLISWFTRDPARELSRLGVPILIVGGTTDIQVPVAEAKILAKADPRARLVIIKGMNHVLKSVPADMGRQIKSYGDPDLPLAPGLVEAISRFVLRSP